MLTTNQTVTLVVFALTYVTLVFAYRWRLPIVVTACALLLLWPELMSTQAALHSVNWNVVMLYFGMLLLTETLIISRAPEALAQKLVREGLPARWAVLLVCVAAGLISTVVENVAAVLIVAPIALAVARRLNMSPAPVLIGVALSSNLQGAATMIGDPPSMLLAGALDMNFNDFFWYHGRPSIFFAVELGAIVATLVLWFLLRKCRGIAPVPEHHKLQSVVPLLLLLLLTVGLAFSGPLLPGFELTAGLLSLLFGVVAALWWTRHHSPRQFFRQVLKLDWGTGLFIITIFVLVGSLTENGLTERFAQLIARFSGDNLFLAYGLVVWGSVLGSAFIDNVPFVAAMLPVCVGLAQHLGVSPQILCFGMMIGASVGGNITPIGASANIVAVGIAKREGFPISFRQFVTVGLPFTLFATTAVYLFLWVCWR